MLLSAPSSYKKLEYLNVLGWLVTPRHQRRFRTSIESYLLHIQVSIDLKRLGFKLFKLFKTLKSVSNIE